MAQPIPVSIKKGPDDGLLGCPASPTSAGFEISPPPRDTTDAIRPHDFVLASRGSQLALAQTNSVQSALAALFNEESHPKNLQPTFKVVPMSTEGDRNRTMALYLIGGTGDKALWTKDLEVALLQGRADMLVHSLKDVPTTVGPDASGSCELIITLARQDPRDALVVKSGLPYKTLGELPEGSVIGTSSVRRIAQLRHRYPNLKFTSVRGNIDTRIKKLDAEDSNLTAIILAAAGLHRLDRRDRITTYLGPPDFYYAVGQGALGVEVRTPGHPPRRDDGSLGSEEDKPHDWDDRTLRIRDMVKRLEHWRTSWACLAERELLRVLEGGCSVPVGCYTQIEPLEDAVVAHSDAPGPRPINEVDPPRRARLTMDAIIASLMGEKLIHVTVVEEISNPEQARLAGRKAAEELVSKGGRSILQDLGRRLEEQKAAAASPA